MLLLAVKSKTLHFGVSRPFGIQICCCDSMHADLTAALSHGMFGQHSEPVAVCHGLSAG